MSLKLVHCVLRGPSKQACSRKLHCAQIVKSFTHFNFKTHQLKTTNQNVIKTSQDYDAENDDKDNDMDAKIDVTSQEESSVRCVEFGVVYRAREADIVGTKSF